MLSGAPSDVLAGACGYRTEIASWRGPTLLASLVPLTSGRLMFKADQDIPDTLSITVPRIVDGFDWMPNEDDYLHPLAKMGQELVVRVIVTSALTGIEYATVRGRYQIQDVEEQTPGLVTVAASGMLQVVADDKLPTPTVPRTGGTFFSEFRRLMPSGLGVAIDPSLTDRACPQSLAWSEDRLAALRSLAEAMPALLRNDATGQAMLRAPLADNPTPVITISDGEISPTNNYPVLVGKTQKQTREGVYNSWVVHGTSTDDPTRPPVSGQADQTTGPFAVDPNGFRTRRAFFGTPLLTTDAQCQLAAQTRLRNGLRLAAVVPITMAPDPRLELDDAARVRSGLRSDGSWAFDTIGYVVGGELPLTIDDGAMRLDVGVG